MTKKQLQATISQGSICISMEASSLYPGYVRMVRIKPDLRVVIEYEVYGVDGGGAYFEGHYSNLEIAIDDLESYLSKSIEAWQDCDQIYKDVSPPLDVDLPSSHRAFANSMRTKTIPLPTRTLYTLTGSTYWTNLLESAP